MQPPKYPPKYKIIPIGAPNDDGLYSMQLRYMTKDGTMYFSDGGDLYKSDDQGETITKIYDGTGTIMNMEVLANGDIVIARFDGTIAKSTDGGQTFDTVYTSPYAFAFWGGLSAYDNLLLACAYQGDGPKEVYLSIDYGDTWKVIQHGPGGHPHAAVFDPYESLIWVAWGDLGASRTIYFTDDLGATWQEVKEGVHPRATNIMPFPKHVLFGTDEDFVMGLYRHTRPKMGTTQTDVNVELYWRIAYPVQDDAYVWATRPAQDYSKHVAYWGYLQRTGNGILPASIYVTDGEDVYPVWTQDKIADGQVRNGIIGVWGPNDNNQLAADLRSVYEHDGQTYHKHIVIVDLD